MPLMYVHTDYLYTTVRQHITYVTTRPALYPAPGVDSPFPTTPPPEEQPAVSLDALIATRRQKARRMKQR